MLRFSALAAWAGGAVVAAFVHYEGPQYCEAVAGLLAGAALYLAAERLVPGSRASHHPEGT
ncbi:MULTISPECIES: hypothetical protein [unclassified Streptomyces]|uniref:hypothetical protein n=1 Tax=unclassified Streptomyces TaxID=2593676 RepID=UPI00278BD814|nr:MULTISPECIES: hypothetical protein [unclassified Streptomyces]